MQVIYLLEKISAATGVSFEICLFCSLLVIELGLIAAFYVLLQILVPEKSPGRLVFWAISLNPICILLTCQHGNFDGLVALSVVLVLIAVVSFQKSGDPIDWLMACLLLGVAILVKTAPMVLIPLLFVGLARLRARTVVLGSVLAAGPVVLGMSIIYVLAPAAVRANVLGYRSVPGYFGITGLLEIMNLAAVSSAYARVFPYLVAVSVSGLAFWAYRLPENSERLTVLIAAGEMLAIPLFGPGFGSQYVFWSIPLLAAVYYLSGDTVLRRLLLIAYGIAATTYVIDYSLSGSLGNLAVQLWPQPIGSQKLVSWAAAISTKGGETLLRVPLFLVLIIVFVMIVHEAGSVRPSTALSPRVARELQTSNTGS